MDEKYLVCLICCEEFKCGCDGWDLGRKEENVKSLKQFCEVVLEGNKNVEEDEKLSNFLNNPDDNLSICGNCLNLISKVTETRLSARCVEESVEKLQMLLLRELRRLQGRLDMFWSEFKKIEETLINGDLIQIGNNLEESYSKRMDGGKEKLERSKEIVGFRVKITGVFRGFHQFHSKLVDKISPKPPNRVLIRPTEPVSLQLNKIAIAKKMVDAKSKVEIQKKLRSNRKCVDKQRHNKNDKVLSSPTPKEIGNEEDDDDGDWDWDNESLGNDTTDNYSYQEDDPLDFDFSQDDGNTGSIPEIVNKASSPRPSDKTTKYQTQIKRLLQKYEPHLAQLPPFQANLVKSILKCQSYHENLEKEKGPKKLNVYQRHMVHLSYNVETQIINLRNIPIKIVCQSDVEEHVGRNGGLLCTKCDFKVEESPEMQRLMYDHVLSKHLNAYQCGYCETDKQFESFEQFKNHSKVCPKVGKVNKARTRVKLVKIFKCEECGKMLSSKYCLLKHKITHKAKEERELLICEKCGKSFLVEGCYKEHLKWGRNCGEEDLAKKKEVSCPKCGKKLRNKGSLRVHLKYMHAEKEEGGGDLKAFICERCGKRFKNLSQLNGHERVTHLGERKWICEKCGKGFKTRFHLKRHKKEVKSCCAGS